MRGWFEVYKKEIREFTRDKRVFYNAVLGPLLLEVLIIGAIGYVETSITEDRSQRVIVVNMAEGARVIETLKKADRFFFIDVSDLEVGKQALSEKEGRVLLYFPKGFKEDVEKEVAPEFQIIYDPLETKSKITLHSIQQILSEDIKEYALMKMKAINLKESDFTPYLMKTEEAPSSKPFAGEWLIGFLPYLIVLWAFYGGFAIVADLVAGEKERGSLETLLVSPLARESIAVGKFFAIASVSMLSCISALAGVLVMGYSNLSITKRIFEGGFTITPLSAFSFTVTLIPLVVLFAGVLLAVSTYSRNQREVQSYLSLMSFVVLVPAIFSQFIGYTDLAHSKWLPFVPILNSATVMRESLANQVNWYHLGVTSAVGIFLAVAGVWVAIKLFTKESVLLRV